LYFVLGYDRVIYIPTVGMQKGGTIMRIAKEGQERKTEILDMSEKLFFSKGYDKATINDILGAVKISKGAFYYHFSSKEEVLDAIIHRRGDDSIRAAEIIAADSSLDVHQKLLQMMLAQKPSGEQQEDLIDSLHEIDNAQMHQKSLCEIVKRLAPVMSLVVEQGVKEGVFTTAYALESSEFLLAIAHTIFDSGYFHFTSEEFAKRLSAFITTIERTLGAQEGSMMYVKELLET
jgi:AcrR family transcriptional regulator